MTLNRKDLWILQFDHNSEKISKFWNSKTLFFKENNNIYFWTHHSFKNFPKNNMFAIQPASFYSRDKELWAIGIFTSISHTQPAWTIMLQLKVLIIKSITIYAFTWLIGKERLFFSKV